MNDPNASLIDRAGAAMGAAADAVKSNYHASAATAKYNEAKHL